jgi:uracil-DNA glycosylase family 4
LSVVRDRNEMLDDLKQRIRECKECRLWETRTNALPGEGNCNSRVMLVAQAPGQMEDKYGKMFIGPSGKKLDELLQEVDESRQELYMTNLIKCMLPKYRQPKQDEIETCAQHLNEEIRLINPLVIATLGYYSASYIFRKYHISLPKPKKGFSGLCGRVFLTDHTKILPLRHPAVLLYNGSVREEMVKNYRKLETIIVNCK